MSRRFSNCFSFTVLASVLLFFVSCSTTRKTIKEPLKERGASYLVREMKKAELDFDTFSARAKASATIGKGNTTNFNAQIRIKKDSLIWLSINAPLGIEIARIAVTPDSVFFINRLEKTYFKEQISLLSGLFQTNLDYDMLQSLLIGNDLSNYENVGFKASIDRKEYKLTAANRQKVKKEIKKSNSQSMYVQHIWLNPDNFKISKIDIKEFSESVDNRTLSVSYDEFMQAGARQIPVSLQIMLNMDQNIQLKIHYSNVSMDEKLSFPFKISDKYSRMI